MSRKMRPHMTNAPSRTSDKSWRTGAAIAALAVGFIMAGAGQARAVFVLTLAEDTAERLKPLSAADQAQLDQIPVGTYITGLHYTAGGASTGGANAEGDQIVIALVGGKKTITSFTSDTPSDRSPRETDSVTFGGTGPFFLDASMIVVNSDPESTNPIIEPEPPPLSLMLMGLALLAVIRSRRKA